MWDKEFNKLEKSEKLNLIVDFYTKKQSKLNNPLFESLFNFFNKLKIIALSRLKKPKQEGWIKDRRKVCDSCEFNTKNIENISLKQKVVNLLSNILTLVTTGKLNEDNSACKICTCTLAYKIPEPTENCDKNKWKQ